MTTIRGGFHLVGLTILGVTLAVVMSGCTDGQRFSGIQSDSGALTESLSATDRADRGSRTETEVRERPSGQQEDALLSGMDTDRVTDEPSRPVRPSPERTRQAEEELGRPLERPLPAAEPPAPPPDRAAIAIVSAIDRAMESSLSIDAASPEHRKVVIGPIRNFSRASDREFRSAMDRFAELLTHAGARHDLGFVVIGAGGVDPSETAYPLALLGSAYLVTADGFDHWEFYLRLSHRSDANGRAMRWTVWEPGGAIRLLRRPRPDAPQLFVPAELMPGNP